MRKAFAGCAAAAIALASAHALRAASSSELQRLIDAAPAGATLLLPAGSFRGSLVVAKRLVLVGNPAGTELSLGSEARSRDPSGCALRVAADGVEVRSLRIRSALFGIRIEGCRNALVSGCSVEGRRELRFSLRGDGIRVSGGSGVTIEDVRISQVCDGIYLDGTADATVRRCEVSDGRYGLHIMYGRGAAVEALRTRRVIVGAMVMGTEAASVADSSFGDGRDPRSAGLVLFESSNCSCRGNRMASANDGILLSGARGCRIEGNVVSRNARGITVEGDASGSVVAGNSFLGNGEQVGGAGNLGSIAWAESGRGNYWDDYKGFDFDRDGIGDAPYRRPRSYAALSVRSGLAGIFFGSPLQRVVDDLDPQAEIVDPSPLARRPASGRAPGSAAE